ncbi:hypothetical protein HZA97_05740 [Candidatus Woesearchaeota archaeon]|nr:hypothetical protein [Candidatus Woesearchaeota archaeon]
MAQFKFKRRLTETEEFELMKIVLDKFLWLGVLLSGFGLYQLALENSLLGASFLLAGFVLMFLFSWFIKKEFELIR